MGIFDWLFGKKSSAAKDWEWRRSESGNATRTVDGTRVTLFEQGPGWKFCIARDDDDDAEPWYSDLYETREAAAYEARALIDGLPTKFRTMREARSERMSAEARNFVTGRAAVIEEIEASISPGSVGSLRKTERRIQSEIKALRRASERMGGAGVGDVDRMVARLQRHLAEVERLIAVAKSRPNGREQ